MAAADRGSFSAAAMHLNIEISAVSRAVRDLEDSIGVAIFERLPRGVRLTGPGDIYVSSARDIIQRYERASVNARLAVVGRVLHLSIGFPWSAASKPMVGLLRSFAEDLPASAVAVVEVANDELLDRVRTGTLDVAIAATDPPTLPRLKSVGVLSTLPLWLEPLTAVGPATLNVALVTWADLAKVRLLCREIDDWPRFVRHVERLDGTRLVFEPHAVSQEGVLGLVAAGLGWALLPSSLDHLLPADVRAVPVTSTGAELQVEALWRPENDNPVLTRFLALCRQLYAPPPDVSDAPSEIRDRSP